MENLIDTIMNILVFAFIGLMIWLYAKEDSETERKKRPQHRDGA